MPGRVHVRFLGGLGQIGRNCAVIEAEGKLLLIDCGQMFADDATPGVEAILPDFTFLRERAADIVGCIATHGHEDHIGALPYLLRDVSFPVFATPFTLALVRHKLAESRLLDQAELVPLADGDRRRIGPFDCEFLPVTHSTPSGVISVIRTPQGVIVHSGDLKIDPSPVDDRLTDLGRLEEISRAEGVRLLLADSTNADSPGRTKSETHIGDVLAGVFTAHRDRRIIVASFASHIHRLQQVADLAVKQGRIVVPVGLSMVRNIKLARDLGLMHIPDAHIADADHAERLDPSQVCVMCTGSQGEHRSALWQMVQGESRFVSVTADDTVVFSSHPIPGNEAAVARLRNGLARLGAEVVHSGQLDVHTSGHAKQDELADFHRAVGAEFFVPVHGEHAHLHAHAKLARQIGMPERHVVVCVDGQSVTLDEHGLSRGPELSGAMVYVDGRVGGVDDHVLHERRVLGENGFVAVFAVADPTDGAIVGRPTILSRGWAKDDDLDELEDAIAAAVIDSVREAMSTREPTRQNIERAMRRGAGSTVAERTRRRPMIVPTVTFVAKR